MTPDARGEKRGVAKCHTFRSITTTELVIGALNVNVNTKNIHDRFEAFCTECSIPIDEFKWGWLLLESDIRTFEEHERQYGEGKTRRPSWGRQAFGHVIKRVQELKRREREELNRLFGED